MNKARKLEMAYVSGKLRAQFTMARDRSFDGF